MSYSSSSKQPKEKNIQVVLRCRPANKSEKAGSSPMVVECDEQLHEINVKQVVGDKLATKTFLFDKVYGPDARQITIYDEVVAPILNEVMMGYNCTIFAYGQTGTGKTYTMEGRRVEGDFRSYKDDPESGIIPRTLHQLFEILESQETEYSIKVSSIELYNEELRDLLCESTNDDPNKLRIFEDAARKGAVIIQGLEEVILQNKNDVYPIMERCGARRQTAATAMNHVSSRSHCVFSITIHMKESTPEGEELLKIGKLNLVDLAGSENIGRSGAVNQRAREAGNINQSLLTLGRVITALVERSPHVPYRESKLTRLLQDSLGGHTRTCIIATISPAAINLEETLSTLDYAYRAKNIKNRPEVNQKLTKKALIREYTSEIEKLKRDLIAAREKNGIYLSQENYEAMEKEIKTQKETIAEMQTRMDVMQVEHDAAVGKLQDVLQELQLTQSDLDSTRTALQQTGDKLAATLDQLEQTIVEKDENKFLVNQHAKTELELSSQASSLLKTLRSCLADMDGLQAKLTKKHQIEQTNRALKASFETSFASQVSSATHQMDEFFSTQEHGLKQLYGNISDISTTTTASMSTATRLANAIAEEFSAASQSMLENLLSAVQLEKSTIGALSAETTRHLQETMSRVTAAHQQQLVPLVNTLKAMLMEQQRHVSEWAQQSCVESSVLLGVTADFCASQKASVVSLESMLLAETESLRAEMEKSTQLLAAQAQQQREAARLKRESVVAQLTALVDQVFDETNDMSSRVTTSAMRMAQSTCTRVTDLSLEASRSLNGMRGQCDTTAQTATAKHVSAQEATAKFASTAAQQVQSCERSLHALQSETEHALFGSESGSVQALLNTHDLVAQEHVGEAIAQCEAIVSSQTDAVARAALRLTGGISERLVPALGDAAQNCRVRVETANEALTAHMTALQQRQTTEAKLFQQWNGDVSEFLNETLQEDKATGETPRKRHYAYPEHLARTEPHDKLLQEFREKRCKEEAPRPLFALATWTMKSDPIRDGMEESPPLSEGSSIADFGEAAASNEASATLPALAPSAKIVQLSDTSSSLSPRLASAFSAAAAGVAEPSPTASSPLLTLSAASSPVALTSAASSPAIVSAPEAPAASQRSGKENTDNVELVATAPVLKTQGETERTSLPALPASAPALSSARPASKIPQRSTSRASVPSLSLSNGSAVGLKKSASRSSTGH